MVKFSKELEAQLIPEWKDAFVDYRQLKKHVKKIKQTLSRTRLSDGCDHIFRGNGGDLSRSSLMGSVRRFVETFSGSRRSDEHQSPIGQVIAIFSPSLSHLHFFVFLFFNSIRFRVGNSSSGEHHVLFRFSVSGSLVVTAL